MRIKISFTLPAQKAAQNVLLPLPSHLKYIVDLEVFLIDKLKLGNYIENSKKGVNLRINGYSLPKSEKIKGLISEDDLIVLEFIESKRKAEKNIENDFDDILSNGILKNEESKDHNFLKMLEEVSLLRRLYHKMKNTEPMKESETQIFSLPQQKSKSKIIEEALSESEKEFVVDRSIAKKAPVKNAKKNKVIEYISSESSEEDIPIVKKKETKAKEEKSKQEKPKAKEEKPKPKEKIISKKIQDDEEDEDEEPEVVKKTIDTSNIGLKILSPEQEYLIKKEHWKSLPIYQWTAKQKEKKNEQQPKLKKNQNYNKTIDNPKETIVDPKFSKPPKSEIKKIEINKKYVEEVKPLPKSFTLVPIKMVNDLWKNQGRVFFKVNDIIKYKCEILTAQYQPGISEFRYGTVTEINKNRLNIDRSSFLRANEEDETEFESNDLFLHNIHEVLISEDCLDEERKNLIQTFMDNAAKFINDQKELLEKKRQLQEKLKQITEKNEDTTTEEINPVQMKKQMLGKQINFYFSDRNYFKDDFMQSHCSKHPDNFMEIKLLLNFPKIRQMTTELPTILDAIDIIKNSTETECNFEVNEGKTLIRKKVPQVKNDSKGQSDKISNMKNLLYSSNLIELSLLIQKYSSNSSVILHHNLSGSLECFKDSTFDNISIVIGNSDRLELVHFGALYNILKAGGSIEISASNTWQDSWNDLITASGFKIESKSGNNSVTAKKPDWGGKGGVASLKNRKQNEGKIEPEVVTKKSEENSAQEKKTNPFSGMAVENTAETIDEDDLLANESGYNKLENPEDCSTKPKACKDCSCGRAELEKNPITLEDKINKIEKGDVSSGCGNCYLGDAFRCSSCPYKGLPAFKPGDKIKLDLEKDNIGGGILKENSTVKVSNGKVKLDI